MKNALLLVVFLFSVTAVTGQPATEQYAQIKIDLSATDLTTIAGLGMEVDHGLLAKGKHLINVYSQRELQRLRDEGIPFEVLIPDMREDYRMRQLAAHDHDHGQARSVDDCNAPADGYNYPTPVNYTYGSMGGYLTYDELLATLDSMTARFPELITAKAPIGDHLTVEGRPIFYLRLSDNPSQDEIEEPEVLYTALHHAREPNSLAQMIFYIWYLLENYETNDEVRYLVDNTAMYFIPCINPDGYVYNEQTDPSGGGFWRKNRRDNEDGSFGVDLNRNYGFEWGHDDQGSSPFSDSETYRGTAAFSEAETQAVRALCNDHNFRITLNYHTFGNLLIYPWGYSDGPSTDQPTFSAMAEVMTRENDFLAGTGSETVGYIVNGNSDDWMYGETNSKPAIFSMTPEVGPRFWPTQPEIDQLNKSCMQQNLAAAHLLLNYGEVIELNAINTVSELTGSLDLELKKYGLVDGELTVAVSGLDNNVTIIGNNSNTFALSHLESENFQIDYFLSDQIENGSSVDFLVTVDNGAYVSYDTIRKLYLLGDSQLLLEENGGSLSNWTLLGDWGLTSSDFVSAPTSFTDSPGDEYNNDVDAILRLDQPIDLSGLESAQLEFYAKWDIEDNYDFVQVMVATDPNGGFTPLCGQYTNPGSPDQNPGPLYDGIQDSWVLESMDLSAYLGQTIYLQFLFVSDFTVTRDGFYFDDLVVRGVSGGVSTSRFPAMNKVDFKVAPNPVQSSAMIYLELPSPATQLEIQLTDLLGRQISRTDFGNREAGQHTLKVPMETLPSGVYYLQLLMNGQLVGSERVIR